MMYVIVMARIPAVVVGGWLAGHVYMRVAWRYLQRKSSSGEEAL